MNQVNDLDPIRKAESMWAGISNSGVRIEGYTYPVVTAFPSTDRSKRDETYFYVYSA